MNDPERSDDRLPITRRSFLTLMAAALVGPGKEPAMEPSSPYKRANPDWLAQCRYGIGIHWTAQTMPHRGSPLPFPKAVAAFNLERFIEGVRYAGAEYVLFTATHALQMLPAPHPVLDRILPGRTSERDLLGELADGLGKQGIRLLLYYNHSCNSGDDPPWERAVGYLAPDKARLAANLCEIVAWMGERYRQKVRAWWFDSPYSLDPRGPYNSVTTDMAGFAFPWERFTVSAKQGHEKRLVTYNAGVNATYLYTTHQDYWAGEMVDLDHPPTARFLPSGLQWFGWTCLDEDWVHAQRDTPVPPPRYPDDRLLAFLRTCRTHRAPMTFNVGITQEGTLAAPSLEQLRRIGAALREAHPG